MEFGGTKARENEGNDRPFAVTRPVMQKIIAQFNVAYPI